MTQYDNGDRNTVEYSKLLKCRMCDCKTAWFDLAKLNKYSEAFHAQAMLLL